MDGCKKKALQTLVSAPYVDIVNRLMALFIFLLARSHQTWQGNLNNGLPFTLLQAQYYR